jgi:hypothetical protein
MGERPHERIERPERQVMMLLARTATQAAEITAQRAEIAGLNAESSAAGHVMGSSCQASSEHPSTFGWR